MQVCLQLGAIQEDHKQKDHKLHSNTCLYYHQIMKVILFHVFRSIYRVHRVPSNAYEVSDFYELFQHNMLS